MIYFTELENLPIHDVKGNYLGRVADVLVRPGGPSWRVASYLARTPKNELLCISYEQMQSVSPRSAAVGVLADKVRPYTQEDEALLRVKKDVLDQQIIDVNLRKVVRVNDVDFDIQPADGHVELRILAVDVGWAAAVRRLLQGTMAKHSIRIIADIFPSKTIPWEFVNLIEPDPARRVRLRISFDRLARLHPADIADILEDLSRHEQKAVIESLDHETAAQALSEIPTHMQAAFLESVTTEKAADIVEEMAPDEAADVLQELPPQTTAEVLADMRPEEAKEVRELLGFEEKTAGALMTTEFVMLGETATVKGAIEALRNYEGPRESVHALYLINNDRVFAGAVALASILLADARTPLKTPCSDPVISVQAHEDEKVVVGLFQKYNLVALPVLDEKGHLLGVVTADDVLELAFKSK